MCVRTCLYLVFSSCSCCTWMYMYDPNIHMHARTRHTNLPYIYIHVHQRTMKDTKILSHALRNVIEVSPSLWSTPPHDPAILPAWRGRTKSTHQHKVKARIACENEKEKFAHYFLKNRERNRESSIYFCALASKWCLKFWSPRSCFDPEPTIWDQYLSSQHGLNRYILCVWLHPSFCKPHFLHVLFVPGKKGETFSATMVPKNQCSWACRFAFKKNAEKEPKNPHQFFFSEAAYLKRLLCGSHGWCYRQ